MSDKLTLREIIAATDFKAFDLWDEVTPEQRKSIPMYLLVRYCSLKKGTKEEQIKNIKRVNERLNKNFFNLSKHPKLQWQLACASSISPKKERGFEWVGYKKSEGNKRQKFIEALFPYYKQDELDLMNKILSDEDLKNRARDLGYEESEIKKLL